MDLFVTANAFKAQLLIGLAVGTAFALFVFLCEPLIRRTTRDEANRLILAVSRRLSTYVLAGLAFGGLMTGYMLMMSLVDQGTPLTMPVVQLVFLLNVIGLFGATIAGRLLAKRLAKQLLAQRKPPV